MNIAESIIKSYNEIRESILKARTSYLQTINKKTVKKCEEFLNTMNDENERLINMQNIRKIINSNKDCAKRRLQKIEEEYMEKCKIEKNANACVYKMKRKFRTLHKDMFDIGSKRRDHEKAVKEEQDRIKEERKAEFLERNFSREINTNY